MDPECQQQTEREYAQGTNRKKKSGGNKVARFSIQHMLIFAIQRVQSKDKYVSNPYGYGMKAISNKIMNLFTI